MKNYLRKLTKDKTKKILPLVAILGVILVIVFICIIVNANRINIKDYVVDSIEFSGYNGYATVDTYENDIVDIDTMLNDLGCEVEDLSQAFLVEAIVYSAVDVNYVGGEPSNLKNGDVVTYNITVDYDSINSCDLKKKLKGKDEFEIVYTVQGLKEPTMMDPFEVVDKIVVQYNSYSEMYSVNIEYFEEFNGYTVEESNSGYVLKNDDETFVSVALGVPAIKKINDGEQITITLENETDKYVDKGIIFSETKKEFKVLTCKNLKSRDEVTETSYNKLKNIFDEEVANGSAEYEFVEMYFYSEKNSSYSDRVSNSIIGIYKYQSEAIGSEPVYIYCSLENPIISSDGEIVTFNDTVYIHVSIDEYDNLSELKNKLSSDYNGFLYYTEVLAFDKISF